MKLLLVEDNPGDALAVRELLCGQPGAPVELVVAASLGAAMQRLDDARFDVVLLDLGLPDSQGLETLERLHAQHPGLPVVVLSGLGDDAVALRAVRAGAQDYLVKGEIGGDLLARALRYAVERQQAKADLRASASSWQATFDAIGDAVFLLDTEQRVLRSNQAMLNLVGLSAEELRGRFCYEVVHDQCEPLADCPFHRMHESRERCSMKLDSGSTCYQIHVDPLYDDRGDLAGAVHTIADITVQHLAARATARSERQHRILGLVGQILLEQDDPSLWPEILRVLCEGFASPRGLVGVVDARGDLVLRSPDVAAEAPERVSPDRTFAASAWVKAPWAVALRERRASRFSQSSVWAPLGPESVQRLLAAPMMSGARLRGFVALADDQLLHPRAPLSLVADRVVLEITERASLDAVGDLRQRIASLRRIGFRIAVDDLGAGYAGLTSFAILAPDIVKIDMSLIRGVDREVLRQKLVRSLARTCMEMGILVVAEGIETGPEHDAVVRLGCGLLQGFLLGRPCPPGELSLR